MAEWVLPLFVSIFAFFWERLQTGLFLWCAKNMKKEKTKKKQEMMIGM